MWSRTVSERVQKRAQRSSGEGKRKKTSQLHIAVTGFKVTEEATKEGFTTQVLNCEEASGSSDTPPASSQAPVPRAFPQRQPPQGPPVIFAVITTAQSTAVEKRGLQKAESEKVTMATMAAKLLAWWRCETSRPLALAAEKLESLERRSRGSSLRRPLSGIWSPEKSRSRRSVTSPLTSSCWKWNAFSSTLAIPVRPCDRNLQESWMCLKPQCRFGSGGGGPFGEDSRGR
ncbi:Gamma-Interferon-Inducible Protein 16 [Manis pentadactyla]|nr:Gamma-Interferon-Inducible Protein 16 [Manis pentadactyla]